VSNYCQHLFASLVWLTCTCIVTYAAPVREFVDVSDAPGLGLLPYAAPQGMAAGLAAADYDDDGDIDLFVPSKVGHADQLYQNQGNGSFLEIAGQVGLASLARSKVALWFDADNDNLLDFLVGSDCSAVEGPLFESECYDNNTLTFYRQLPSGQFLDQTLASGFTGELLDPNHFHRGGMAAGDINNDGFLDIMTTVWKGGPSVLTQLQRLYLNNRDGTFTDITASAQFTGSAGGSWQPMMADFNKDGFLDIYAAIDFTDNRLWVNNQNNTFTDLAFASGSNNAMNDMGVALGDYDNDRDLDIYITNVYSQDRYNVLLRNDSDPNGSTLAFNDVSEAAGCDQGHWGWGATFIDMENNGLLDIAATNGYYSWWIVEQNDLSVFYRNTGNHQATFIDASADVGFNDDLWGSALLAFDYNRDGWLDLAQAAIGAIQENKVRLLENRRRATADPNLTANNYLVIKPRMCGANRRAIGATIEVTAGSLTMMRLISAGCSLMGQEPAEAFFGLGANPVADSVTIHWPSGGGVTQLANVSANQVVTVLKPAPGDLDTNSKVNLQDYQILAGEWMQSGPALLSDVTGDGQTDLADLLHLSLFWMTDCQ